MDDRELIAYLDRRFRESAQQIESFRAEVNGRFQQNDGRLERIEGRLDQNDGRLERIEGRLDQNDGRLERIEGRLDQNDGRLERIEGRFDQNDGRFDRLEETVRHTQILVEGLRGDTRLLAEKVGTLDDKIQGARSELKAEIGDVKDLLVRSYRDHDSRIRDLESRVKKRASGKSRPHLE